MPHLTVSSPAAGRRHRAGANSGRGAGHAGRRLLAAVVAVAATALGLVALPDAADAANGRVVSDETLLYPRAIRLQHSGAANGRIVAIATAFPNGPAGAVFSSTDGGITFGPLGRVSDPVAASTGLCCTTLFELPEQIGSLPAGTLLWAGAVGQGPSERRMSLRVWRSADSGRTWTYLSAIATSPSNGGIWEPEFGIDAQGRLTATYADETRAGRSQVLSLATSTDAVSWTPGRIVVQGPSGNNRPGMPTVRRLPSGRYLMTYEVCGFGPVPNDCEIHYRTSPDGADWGDPNDLGPRLDLADGRFVTGTPTFVLTSTGRFLATAQVLRNRDGSVAADNGRSLLSAPVTATGIGPVTTVPAPFAVNAAPGVCPNYSSSLVPSGDGGTVVMMATDLLPDGTTCRAYTGRGLLPPTTSPTAGFGYTKGKCMDVKGGGGAAGKPVQIWDCSNAPNQRWTLAPDGSIRAQGLCLEAPGYSPTTLGAKLQVWDCNGLPLQKWVRRADFSLFNPNSGYCVNAPDSATANGTPLQLWRCNGTVGTHFRFG